MTEADRRHLADEHVFLVFAAARKVLGTRENAYGLEYGDLVGEGGIALTEASRRYDPARNPIFGGYAWSRIVGRMLDAIRDASPMRRRGRDLVAAFHAEHERLSQEIGTEASVDATFAALEWTDHCRATCALAMSSAPCSIDELAGSADDRVDVARDAIASIDREKIGAAVAALPPRQAYVIARTFFDGVSARELARAEGIDDSALTYTKQHAFRHLRESLREYAA